MCGICGIFGGSDAAVTEEMTSALVHRGPDDGQVVSQAQPMILEDVWKALQPLL